jgi:DNA polymerase V
MVGLMDCNNFFVSCERVFRPDLKGKPVAVLSSNDGCIVARSQEVKDLGIEMGIPYFEVKDVIKKHQVTIFSSNFTLYRDLSSRVMQALREEFGEIQIYSIDESFFEVPERTTVESLKEVRTRIMQKTGIPVSFGIAPTKTMAKIANGQAKKGTGVVWLTLDEARTLYPTVVCGSIWGIGRRTSARLTQLGIGTVHELLASPKALLRAEFGVVGERLFLELSGVRTDEKNNEEDIQGSIMSTRSFGKPVMDKDTLMGSLGHHISELGEKLRERDCAASYLRILCATSRHGDYAFRSGSRTVEFMIPTNNTVELLKAGKAMLEELFEKGIPYKKAGAIVSGLIPTRYIASSLFVEGSQEKGGASLDRVVDALNERFGKSVIRSGVIMHEERWLDRKDAKSPNYTTRWDEIAIVQAL